MAALSAVNLSDDVLRSAVNLASDVLIESIIAALSAVNLASMAALSAVNLASDVLIEAIMAALAALKSNTSSPTVCILFSRLAERCGDKLRFGLALLKRPPVDMIFMVLFSAVDDCNRTCD